MRVAWVHPSWRDLVIEHLAADDAARGRYLRASSIHGTLLALSTHGGAQGTRRLPLLAGDGDWDAVNDRVHTLASELEPAELIGLLDAIRTMRHALRDSPARAEGDALARTALVWVATQWTRPGAVIAVAELVAWLELGSELSPRPAPPPLAATWVDLWPVRAPDLSDFRGGERFADWLGLAEALLRFDPSVLPTLGWGADPPHAVLTFVDEVARAECGPHLEGASSVPRALDHLGRLFPVAAEQWPTWRQARARASLAEEWSWSPDAAGPVLASRSEPLDVERILRDL